MIEHGQEHGQLINKASGGRPLSEIWHISYFNVSGYAAILFMPSGHCVLLLWWGLLGRRHSKRLQASRHRGRKHKVLSAGSAHSVNAFIKSV